MGASMAGNGIVGGLLRGARVTTKPLLFFAGLAFLGYFLVSASTFRATEDPPADLNNAINLTLGRDGNLYAGKRKLPAEITLSGGRYIYRYQTIGNLVDVSSGLIDQFSIAVTLPTAANDELIGHHFRSNGGALSAESKLIDSQTVLYTATQVGPETKLALELEVPEAFIQRSALLVMREKIEQIPLALWAGLAIGLPVLAGLLVLLLLASRHRKLAPLDQAVEQPPSRLRPAVLGILLNGQLTTRDIAATFVDLARRGHLIIRQVDRVEYRFRRHGSADRLEPFEQELLNQVFGATGDAATMNEVSLSLGQEVFSARVSTAFLLAYQSIEKLGYFYRSPWQIHRRYQIVGIGLFGLGVVGFFLNLLFFSAFQYLLFGWVALLVLSLLITRFSRRMSVRTVFGDRELAKWLAFRRFLSSSEAVKYEATGGDQYLAYLAYAIVFDVETAWTKRFYSLPFVQPTWYVSDQTGPIDSFVSRLFPLFGHIGQAMAMSVRPTSR